jgi:thiamine transport system permease protein
LPTIDHQRIHCRTNSIFGPAAIGPCTNRQQTPSCRPGYSFETVELPLLSRAITSGAAFAFALSIGEFNSSLLLSEPFQSTIPVAIYRLVSAYNFSGACVLGSILILLCIIAFFLIDRFKGKEEAL